MFCNKCGAKLAAEAAFCNKCGAKMAAGDTPPATNEPPSSQASAPQAASPVATQAPPQTAPPKKKIPGKLIAIGGVLVATAAAVVVFIIIFAGGSVDYVATVRAHAPFGPQDMPGITYGQVLDRFVDSQDWEVLVQREHPTEVHMRGEVSGTDERLLVVWRVEVEGDTASIDPRSVALLGDGERFTGNEAVAFLLEMFFAYDDGLDDFSAFFAEEQAPDDAAASVGKGVDIDTSDWVTEERWNLSIRLPASFFVDDGRDVWAQGYGMSIIATGLDTEALEWILNNSISQQDFTFDDGTLGVRADQGTAIVFINDDVSVEFFSADNPSHFYHHEALFTAIARSLTPVFVDAPPPPADTGRAPQGQMSVADVEDLLMGAAYSFGGEWLHPWEGISLSFFRDGTGLMSGEEGGNWYFENIWWWISPDAADGPWENSFNLHMETLTDLVVFRLVVVNRYEIGLAEFGSYLFEYFFFQPPGL